MALHRKFLDTPDLPREYWSEEIRIEEQNGKFIWKTPKEYTEKISKVTEAAKRNILQSFYMIGILGKYPDSKFVGNTDAFSCERPVNSSKATNQIYLVLVPSS